MFFIKGTVIGEDLYGNIKKEINKKTGKGKAGYDALHRGRRCTRSGKCQDGIAGPV
jgi:hypothetical protein